MNDMTFEEAMNELEKIVKRLEEGRLPLEEAISTFERGTLLKRYCETKLSDAQMRVEKIQKNADGTLSVVPFDSIQAA
jgi:exodeoxyribonuclease VII small subunit